MKCAAIVYISITEADDQELLAGHRAAKKKYSTCPMLDYALPAASINEDMLKDVAGRLNALGGKEKKALAHSRFANRKPFEPGIAGGIGLYWACHANPNDTRPSAKQLARWTAVLYKNGARFVKINLNSCNSGGKKDKALPNIPIDQFCTELTQELGGDAGKLLRGVAVSGYTTLVELVDKQDPYYQAKANEGVDLSQFPSNPHNAEVNHNHNPPVYRPLKLEQKQWTQALKQEASTADLKASLQKINYEAFQKAMKKFRNTKIYGQMWAYAKSKTVRVYGDNPNAAWESKNLCEYTDNKNIFTMIQFLEDLRNFSPTDDAAAKRLLAVLAL